MTTTIELSIIIIILSNHISLEFLISNLIVSCFYTMHVIKDKCAKPLWNDEKKQLWEPLDYVPLSTLQWWGIIAIV